MCAVCRALPAAWLLTTASVATDGSKFKQRAAGDAGTALLLALDALPALTDERPYWLS